MASDRSDILDALKERLETLLAVYGYPEDVTTVTFDPRMAKSIQINSEGFLPMCVIQAPHQGRGDGEQDTSQRESRTLEILIHCWKSYSSGGGDGGSVNDDNYKDFCDWIGAVGDVLQWKHILNGTGGSWSGSTLTVTGANLVTNEIRKGDEVLLDDSGTKEKVYVDSVTDENVCELVAAPTVVGASGLVYAFSRKDGGQMGGIVDRIHYQEDLISETNQSTFFDGTVRIIVEFYTTLGQTARI